MSKLGSNINSGLGIELGSMSAATRNAGVSTAIGTIIYNSTTSGIESYGPEGWVSVKGLQSSGMEATGGLINDFESGGITYRSHTFTSSGTFSVNSIGDYPAEVDYLVVAGGGGGGSSGGGGWGGGGGGAGGLRTSDPSAPAPLRATAFTVATGGGDGAGNYTVTIGAGGFGGRPAPTAGDNIYDGGVSSNGTNSYFGPPSQPDGILSTGGGGGGRGHYPGLIPDMNGQPGGSGGGGGQTIGGSTSGGTGNTPPTSPPQGFPGSPGPTGSSPYFRGGGGGAGGAGTAGVRGPKLTLTITGSSVDYGWGGELANVPDYSRGPDGRVSSGDGGPTGVGGAAGGGHGGSGVVVIKYRISSNQRGTAKATGGNISYVNSKIVHQFTSSGTFTITDSSLTSVDYLVVAGGGGGGSNAAGGGGAGGFRTGTSFPVNPSPGSYSITVGSGGGGNRIYSPGRLTVARGSNGSNSVFSTITSAGGGGGGSRNHSGGTDPSYSPGNPGGSGGGASADAPSSAYGNGNDPPVTPSQGNRGGGGSGAHHGGGGGGAGENGKDSPQGEGNRTGGNGLASSLSGVSVTYAGGGGSGGAYGSPAPLGGSGGGGNGAGNPGGYRGGDSLGGYGDANTGGGGGGASNGSSSPPGVSEGGNGGSGIVIISYPA